MKPKQIDFKAIEKLTFYLLCIMIFTIPLARITTLYISDVTPIRGYALWTLGVFLGVSYFCHLDFNKYKFSKIEILIFIFIGLGIISTIWAKNTYFAIFGAPNRYEGLLTLITYNLIFLNTIHLKDSKYRQKIIDLFILSGIISSIFGLMQVYQTFPFIKQFQINYLSSGLCGNPNFLGSYLILLLGVTTMKFLLTEKFAHYYFWTSLLFFGTLITTQSLGPFLAFILMVILITVFLIIKKVNVIKKISILFLSLIAVFLYIDFTTTLIFNTIYKNEDKSSYILKLDLFHLFNEVQGIVKTGKVEDSFGNGRMYIWRETIPLIPKYYLVGAGIDNFGIVFPQKNPHLYYDKAHNEYLQILITEGALALITYLTFLFIILYNAIKKVLKDKNINPLLVGLLISFICYCFQAFANISAISVAPYFYLVMGLLIGYNDLNKVKKD